MVLDYKQAFDSMYPDLAATYEVPLFPRFFAGLLAAAGMQDGLMDFMQADGIHPNKDGVARDRGGDGSCRFELSRSVTQWVNSDVSFGRLIRF